MGTKRTPYRAVTSNLGKLSKHELQQVADMVRGLMEAYEDREAEAADDRTSLSGSNGYRMARGHIEAKIINGCGPYFYLRYWAGKTLKSQYIGKEWAGNYPAKRVGK